MCPIVRNDNSHRASPNSREDLRLAAGEVREVNGEDADLLAAVPGVVVLEGDEGEQALEAYRDSLHTHDDGVTSPTATIGEAVSAAHLLTNAVVGGMNSRVIGDDQAPHGPGTGTVTTKQAVQQHDPAHFGPGEAAVAGEVRPQVPSPAGGPTSADVHNEQVKHADATREVTEQIIAATGQGDGPDDDVEPDDELEVNGEPVLLGDEEIDALQGDDLDAAVAKAGIDASTGGSNQDKSLSAPEKRQALKDKRAADEAAQTAGA